MKQGPKTQTAQNYINVEAIQDSILWTEDKHLFAFLRLRGRDNSLLDQEGHETVTDALTVAMAEETAPWQILSVPRTVDTRGMIRELRTLEEDCRNTTRRSLLEGEISSLEELTESGAQEPQIILKLWLPAAPGADRKLLDRAERIAQALENNGIHARVLDDAEILALCSAYAELGVWQGEPASDIPILPGRKRLFSRKRTPEEESHAALLERITPMGLEFHDTWFLVGGAYCRCYGVNRYPAELDYGWAVRLTGATDCVTCITFYPGQAAEIGDAISRSVRDSRRSAQEERDLREQMRQQRSAASGEVLIDKLDGGGQTLGQISIVTMPFAQSREALDGVCQDVVSRYAAKKMRLKILSCIQSDAFRHLSPYYPDQPRVGDCLQRVIPLETLMGGYPFTINTLRDDHGYYFARTADRGIVSLDIRYRGEDRTNGNGIVTGVAGVGKSTMLKAWLQSMVMSGMKCVVIDPEREFRDLCLALGGSWLDAGGGQYRYNPLEVQAPLRDEEGTENIYGADPNAFGQHLQILKSLMEYKLPGLTQAQLALLERSAYGLYARYGIDNDWAYDPNWKNYPTMEDWYRYLLDQEDPRYEELALLMEHMAVGSEAAIWNGQTNIDLDADLVVIDTKRLCDAPPSTRTAQYYSLMRLIFSKVSYDRETPYFILTDESQMLFDRQFPAGAVAMKNMAVRCRKYEGYLWMIFHSIHEMLDSSIREYGQVILDTAAYKVLFGTDGQNLVDTVELYKLTRAEERVLSGRQRGRAVALIGAQHLVLNFQIPRYKLALMGRGGGR